LVETFELHKITSLPTFRAPQSSKRTGTYFACILTVQLQYQCHDQLVFRAQSEGRLTGVLSIFSHLVIICNFEIIFDPVVGPRCCKNLHRQPIHHSVRPVETHLTIELYFEICVFSMELKGVEKPYLTLLNSAKEMF
jgi:hypothetical protein